jgi:hypothetical protein
MSGKTRSSLLSLTIIAVILFSAFGTTRAYADGGTTTETSSTEVTNQTDEASTETAVPTEVTAEATAIPAEAPTETSETTVQEAAPATTEEAAPTEPVLAAVPENTEVTVVDASGEAQPLATQEAAEAIAASDPIWCPEGAGPTPGANGCTGSFTSFNDLLTFLSGNTTYQGAGTIYVEQGNYNGNDPGGVIDFSSPGYDLSNIRNSNLTLQGGWNTSDGSTTGTSNFTDTRILIGSSPTDRWGGSVAINNITMTFSNPGAAIPATAENALTVYATGDVSLADVDISNAPSAGAEIDAGGGVTIERSKFHRNKTAGAIVRSGGNVAIRDSEFQNPLITRQRRQIVGLDINSAGDVSLLQILASGNREVGTNIVAGGAVSISGGVFNGTMEIVGTRRAPTEFLGYGLQVTTPGEINVDSVTANGNFLWGARLDGGGPIAVQNSIFNANTTETDGFIDDTGLFVYGDSIVSLFNVTANANRLYGTYIEAVGNVSINQSTFNNNRGITNTAGTDTFHGHGMYIDSDADILINNTTATGNSLFGGELIAGGQVAINNSTFSDTGTGSAANAVGQGLQITSGGNTNLAGVVLSNNEANGATIQAGGFAWLENVTATNNGGDGVSLQATCTHLIGGTFSGNGGYGLDLGSSALNLLSPPTFSNNGAGDMNPASPPTCTFFTAAPAATAPTTLSTAATSLFASLEAAPEAGANQDATAEASGSLANVSLSAYLASSKSAQGHIFMGKYAYADTEAGLQVFAFVSPLEVMAME